MLLHTVNDTSRRRLSGARNISMVSNISLSDAPQPEDERWRQSVAKFDHASNECQSVSWDVEPDYRTLDDNAKLDLRYDRVRKNSACVRRLHCVAEWQQRTASICAKSASCIPNVERAQFRKSAEAHPRSRMRGFHSMLR